MTSLAFQLALRPQKTAPETPLRDPADLVDELALLARVLTYIPQRATLRFPVYVDSGGKPGNGKGLGIASDCRHRFNLLFLELHTVIRGFDR